MAVHGQLFDHPGHVSGWRPLVPEGLLSIGGFLCPFGRCYRLPSESKGEGSNTIGVMAETEPHTASSRSPERVSPLFVFARSALLSIRFLF